jgi:hypothetical protein
MIPRRNQPESPPAMCKAPSHFSPPVITIAPDVYDAILLAEGVIVMVEGKPQRPIHSTGPLPDFFTVQRCLLTTGADSGPPSSAPALLRRMVGG